MVSKTRKWQMKYLVERDRTVVIREDGIESESVLSSLSLPLCAFNSGSLSTTQLQILRPM